MSNEIEAKVAAIIEYLDGDNQRSDWVIENGKVYRAAIGDSYTGKPSLHVYMVGELIRKYDWWLVELSDASFVFSNQSRGIS